MHSRTEQEIMKNWKRDKETPAVSVCCPTYNHERYIAEAIEGFLMQETTFPFEILIRDDCSSDKTASIVKEYADKYPTLIKPVYEKENTFSKGVKPMPQLYKIAQGKYIALCDGDDYWTDPNKLQKQVNFLEENPDYVITYTAVEAFNENGHVEDYAGGVIKDLETLDLQQGSALNTSTTCFRNVLQLLPPEFFAAPIGDIFLWSLLGAYGKGKYIKDISPNYYRIHENGVYSKTNSQQRLKIILKLNMVLYLYYDRIGNEKLSIFYEKNIFKSLFDKMSISKLILFLTNQAKIKLKNLMKGFM